MGYYTATASGDLAPAPFNLDPQSEAKCLADIESAKRGHAQFYGNLDNFGHMWIVSDKEAQKMDWRRGPWSVEAFARFWGNLAKAGA